MNTQSSSKTGLFLIELIISIFFFIICAVICIQIFVTSHTISQDTINMNNAILWSNNLSEIFIGSEGDFSFVKNQMKQYDYVNYTNLTESTNLVILLNDKWEPADSLDLGTFIIIVNTRSDDIYAYENISIAKYSDGLLTRLDADYKPDSLIHQIEIKKHIPLLISKEVRANE